MSIVKLTHRGEQVVLTRARVVSAVVEGDTPTTAQADVTDWVNVNGDRYPVKRVLAMSSGIIESDFTTHEARQILITVGFEPYTRHLNSRGDDPVAA
jgi:hypothetical protein